MLVALLGSLTLSMGSPWWEHYEIRDTYLCPDRARLVVERNQAQASLLSGRYRTTLFREPSEQPGLHYSNEQAKIAIRGDVLRIQLGSRQQECLRTDSA
ncbi:MAG: hypothetical protein VKK98_02765 [Cyanobacteriota bacterium]|nr:hypothetical protein [Cyanobacteriota bacterium]